MSKDHESRQRRAYLLWEEAGKPEGMSDYFWDQAASQPPRCESQSKEEPVYEHYEHIGGGIFKKWVNDGRGGYWDIDLSYVPRGW